MTNIENDMSKIRDVIYNLCKYEQDRVENVSKCRDEGHKDDY
jgi:septation ring formation regulator EzrA